MNLYEQIDESEESKVGMLATWGQQSLPISEAWKYVVFHNILILMQITC